MKPLRCDAARLERDLQAMAGFTEPGRPWTRRTDTPEYAAARAWLRAEMEQAGLQTSVDAAGNLIGLLPGSEPDLPPVVVGSHTDTVVGGGRFDGILGVLAGVEVARQLRETAAPRRRSLLVVDFFAEEPTDYGVSTVGSRGFVGNLPLDWLDLVTENGRTLGDAIRAAGGSPEQLVRGAERLREIAVYLELHIEQGPVLEQARAPLGVVTGLVGIRRLKAIFCGEPGHAGTTPMDLRRDAFTAGAQWALSLEKVCRRPWPAPAVGTVGRLHVDPNAANVVPGRVEMIAEVRSIDPGVIDEILRLVRAEGAAIEQARGVSVTFEDMSATAAVAVTDDVQQRLADACLAVSGLPPLRLPSGAGHDANQMSRLGPVGMLFVPSAGGRSHCPEEWTDLDHAALGTAALGTAVQAFLAE